MDVIVYQASLSLCRMSIFFVLFMVTFLLVAFTHPVRSLMQISQAIEWSSTIRQLQTESCKTGNPIDDCWRCDPDWETNRKVLADCAVGFGRNAIGGRDGDIYVVTESDNDDPVNPTPGTLRYGALQEEPLWIIFDHDMVINLKEELVVNSYKTIDGRGFNIQISNGPCIAIYNVSNIIIHNIYIHDCVPAGNALVRDSPNHYGPRGKSDGDGISIFGSRDLWIDHCTLSKCYDGLIDAVHSSTSITISNNYMLHHNEVMLLGHSDEYLDDKIMQVTIAFNFFGEGLVQRMPRCRHGYFHVVNNIYSSWGMYAIGGSANPTINSQGNVFIASDDNNAKEVTKRENSLESEWKDWNWRSDEDLMLNGAFFTPSGNKTPASYMKASSMVARPASNLKTTSLSAGAFVCQLGQPC
ncbi:Pec_lyase_C domain-containing protein [Cephalotus follicularis]|uniref:Pectate lyase n=1 Tax=Cephalotus follicularis TaxID=3775 RepID=A0A1Q3BM85_CEPFO|nr:Pec_lyase_C domain-containing protein [Cephalotus follicularis]